MDDLSRFRSKRALVFGPLWAVEDVFPMLKNAGMQIVNEHDVHVALELVGACSVAFISYGATGSAAIRSASKAAGLPRFCVRRHGRVEVDRG